MKCRHLLAATIALVTSTSLTAQIKKGDILLGASAGTGYNSNSSTGSAGSNSSNANISPRIGFGIGRNSVLGVRTNFSTGKTKTEGTDYKQSSFSVGGTIYWRYFMPIVNKVGWYIEPAAGVNSGRQTIRGYQGNGKATGFGITAAVVPGIYYQALPGLLLNADFGGINYAYYKSKNTNTDQFNQVTTSTSKSNNVSLNLLNGFTFGFDFILGKKG